MNCDLLYWGTVPNLGTLALYWVAIIVLAWLGFAWFQKAKKEFANVI